MRNQVSRSVCMCVCVCVCVCVSVRIDTGLVCVGKRKVCGVGRTRLGPKHVRCVGLGAGGLGAGFAVYVRKYKINSEK